MSNSLNPIIKMKASNPTDILFTMEITMSLSDWKALRKQLATLYPSWKLSRSIDDMIKKAEKEFEQEKEIETDN